VLSGEFTSHFAAVQSRVLSSGESRHPTEIIVSAHCLHHDRSGQNEDDLQERFGGENPSEQCHVMLPRSTRIEQPPLAFKNGLVFPI
jgi:hypothetical protein